MNRYLSPAAFLVGLTVVCWVGVGYIGTNPLAMTMTALIGAFYVMGAFELHRFHNATATLAMALAAISENPPTLGAWLNKVHPSLQNPVRLRIEGERIGLPGPAMTPYLVGLLVLLGMLGTFLGMVVTLNGAVIALESTTDLQAIRASLAAPVKGLGVAFGTSVAGVAASAMLGLMSALCRRERFQTAQLLDTKIASELRVFSLAHQRQETFKTLQVQARVMPEVVDKLQAMLLQMERQSQALSEQLIAGQESFYRHAEARYSDLASSVDKSLKESLTESARIAGATIQPVVEATMTGIARETGLLHERMADAVKMQLDGVSERFGTTVANVSEIWKDALAQHQRTSESLSEGTHASLAAIAETFGRQSASLLARVDKSHGELQAELASRDQQRLGAWTQSLESMAASLQREWQQAGAETRGQQEHIFRTLDETARDITAQAEAHAKSTIAEISQLVQAASGLSDGWQNSMAVFAKTFEQQSVSLLATVDKAHGELLTESASRDQQRLAAWTHSLESMAVSLQREWQQAGVQTLRQQERICTTLDQTARDITAQAEAHARNTITEIAQLMQTASEAPRAAAEVIGQLRKELSDSIARDNALLEERSRIMATVSALLDAVNHASTEQRGAIDALVASSETMLDRATAQFTEKVEAESAKMTTIAAQITGSAVEVSSMGEAFGFGVQLFSESNEKLISNLQRIEASLNSARSRSDEQLAYYVAQAREIIDLSIMSQKQIVDDLQQLAIRQVPLEGAAC